MRVLGIDRFMREKGLTEEMFLRTMDSLIPTYWRRPLYDRCVVIFTRGSNPSSIKKLVDTIRCTEIACMYWIRSHRVSLADICEDMAAQYTELCIESDDEVWKVVENSMIITEATSVRSDKEFVNALSLLIREYLTGHSADEPTNWKFPELSYCIEDIDRTLRRIDRRQVTDGGMMWLT